MMNAPPMRRWQNGAALIATMLAAGALLPLETRTRLILIALAIAAILALLALRLRTHAARRVDTRTAGVYDRIERIREQRDARRR